MLNAAKSINVVVFRLTQISIYNVSKRVNKR